LKHLKVHTIIKNSIFQYLVKNISDHDDLHDHFDDKNYFNIKHVNQNFLKNNLYNNSIDPIEIIETFETLKSSYTIIKISIFQYLVKNISDHDDLHDHFDEKNYFNIKRVNQKFLNNNFYNNSMNPIEIIEPFVTLKSSYHYQKTSPLKII
jgi:hypothetical protein